jgi:hypothetical protein
MHLLGLLYFPNVVSTVAEAMRSEVAEHTVEAVEVVEPEDAVDALEVVAAEITTRVSAPIAKLTAILQMHTESGNALRREETAEKTVEETAEETTSAFATSAGSQAMSKSIASSTNV